MIIVRLLGGHSNQLFQYAVGRSTAIRHNAELKLDLTWFDEKFAHGTTPRHYELGAYPIAAQIATRKDLAKVTTNSARSPLGRLSQKFRKENGITQLTESGLGLNKPVLNAPDNVYLVGYWQNEKYFKDIRPILLKDLEPTKTMNLANKKYLKQIESLEAVSLHIRRGDYVSDKTTNAYHGLMSVEYYKKAVNIIEKNLGGKPFNIFVFSNDIDWCKQNLGFKQTTTFVEGNTDGADDIRLMKHCQHNIMANSSFSWWGAWLNINPDKIIIAPRVWFLDEKSNRETDIIPKDWIRL